MIPHGDEPLVRVGIKEISTIDHRDYVHNSSVIKSVIIEALKSVVTDGVNVDSFIVDFTDNPFVMLREPLLLGLIGTIAESSDADLCSRFCVLIPELPGIFSASIQRLANLSSQPGGSNCDVWIISNSGRSYRYSDSRLKTDEYFGKYAEIISAFRDQPLDKLKKKCIRRLGHFRSFDSNDPSTARCRKYSYYLHACDRELRRLISDWWTLNALNSGAILYDAAASTELKNAIRAFSESKSIIAERITDAVTNVQLQKDIRKSGECTLILDVVDTGMTLDKHIQSLKALGIIISPKILVAISKNGARDFKYEHFDVHAFLSRRSGSEPFPCEQDKLELAPTPESYEPFEKIRTYDMLSMIEASGWEAEPTEEVPDNVGKGYPIVPKFSKLLSEFGDWIAFKAHIMLKRIHPLDSFDWFIVHVDDADSAAFADLLQNLLDYKVKVVKIPRDIIKKAQDRGNEWEEVLKGVGKEDWVGRFEATTGIKALILDIFNGSGNTMQSLAKLLEHLRIEPFAYISLVDFDPENKKPQIEFPRYSLYDWYNPRQLND